VSFSLLGSHQRYKFKIWAEKSGSDPNFHGFLRGKLGSDPDFFVPDFKLTHYPAGTYQLDKIA